MRPLLILTLFALLTPLASAQKMLWAPSIDDLNAWAPPKLTYDQAFEEAVKTGSDLLVFIGCKNKKPRKAGVVVCEVDSLKGFAKKTIVLSRPFKDGNLHVLKVWDDQERLLEVYSIIEVRKEAQPSAPFFELYPQFRSVPPDRPGGDKSAGPRFQTGHNCPSCGTYQNVVNGPGPVPGSHSHRCPRCSAIWWH
jgi:hypothetical protein